MVERGSFTVFVSRFITIPFFRKQSYLFIDHSGGHYYAYSRKHRRLTLCALKLVFGSNNGFKFEGTKLFYYGPEHLTDPRKDYLLKLFLEIVNSAYNHIHLKSGGEVVGAENKFPYFSDDDKLDGNFPTDWGNGTRRGVDGETTISVLNNSGDIITTIFIGGNSYPLGEVNTNGKFTPELDVNGNEIIRSPLILLWHGIGHGVTNTRLNDGYQENRTPNLQLRAKAYRQTVGFENFIISLIKSPEIVQRTGTSHGNNFKENSSGCDNYYNEVCNQKNDNYDVRPQTEEEKSHENT